MSLSGEKIDAVYEIQPARPIRSRTIREGQRLRDSIVDHMHIIEALENRDAELSEKYVREHTNDLQEHVHDYVDWLE